MTSFADPALISGYAERTARIVPGLRDMHRMAGVLLAERAPVDARMLVLGAGGGLELKAFADMQPRWRFDGVDPSAAMLELAQTTLGPLASRVHLHEGYIDSAPTDPFDGAACLLTLHFLPRAERLATLRALHARLKPGAALVVAHHSFPNEGPEQDLWLQRYAAFALAAEVPAAQVGNIAAMKERLPVLSPEQDAALLVEAGFVDVALFYCAFTFKGWVAYRPKKSPARGDGAREGRERSASGAAS
jgi:tRNA (cmo5U34)-methyltransferase